MEEYNLGDLPRIAMALIIFAIVLAIGSNVIINVQEQQTDEIVAHGNTTISWPGNDTYIFLNSRLYEDTVLVYNNGTLVNEVTNYTTSATSVKITNVSPLGKVGLQSGWVTNKINVSYSYYIGSYAYNTSTSSLEGVNTASGYQGTLAIVAMAAIVIGLIMFFYRGPK